MAHFSATLLQTAYVQPEPFTEFVGMPIIALPQLVAGLLNGFIGENHLTEIQTCMGDASPVLADVKLVVQDYEAGKMLSLLNDAQTLVNDLKLAVGDCKSMQDDIAAIESWAQIFKDQTELVSTVTKNALKHPAQLANDIKGAKADWEAQAYYQTGFDLADVLILLIGPVVPVTPEDLMTQQLEFNIVEIPEIVLGFTKAFLGAGDLPEIDACYAGVAPLETYIATMITDIESLNLFDALKQIELFIYHLQLDLLPCTEMQDDIAAIRDWAQIFTNLEQLVMTVAENWLLHKRKIQADIDAFKTDEAAGNYFTAGADLADIVVKLVGAPSEPAPAPAFLQ